MEEASASSHPLLPSHSQAVEVLKLPTSLRDQSRKRSGGFSLKCQDLFFVLALSYQMLQIIHRHRAAAMVTDPGVQFNLQCPRLP